MSFRFLYYHSYIQFLELSFFLIKPIIQALVTYGVRPHVAHEHFSKPQNSYLR
jgi:hypothetical protein